MPELYDSSSPIEIADGVFHLGVQDKDNSFSNVPYLIVDGDEAVFIDPGSMKGDFFATVLRKVHAVIDPRKIKHLIVQHQDPDLCAALPFYEKICGPNVEIACPLEAKVLMQHYGTSHECRSLDDGDTITFGNGRTISFIMTPYCHFVGAMVTYDSKTKSLFSSDAFGGFTSSSDLFAGDDYPIQLSNFLGQYLGSKRAFEYALKRIEKLNEAEGIDRICPQHGCVIRKEHIPMYLKAAHELHVGGEVDALAEKHGIQLD